MLLIGSRALVANYSELTGVRKTTDWDFICTIEQFTAWHKHNREELQFAVPTQQGKYYHARDKDGMNYEFELAWPGTSAELFLKHYGLLEKKWTPEIGPVPAIGPDLLLIKLSHRYKRNSPHFHKTMTDIHWLREKLGENYVAYFLGLPLNTEIMKLREAESYTYAHPKLNVTSKDFFTGDGVNYVYDHDEIHKVVAIAGVPAYTQYMQDGEQVMTSREKFFAVDQQTRLLGGFEESMVLALERSQIPHGDKEDGPSARWSFEMALMKVCTSITSGYFREFCWEHYNDIMKMYEELGETWYVDRFKEAVQNGEILPRSV